MPMCTARCSISLSKQGCRISSNRLVGGTEFLTPFLCLEGCQCRSQCSHCKNGPRARWRNCQRDGDGSCSFWGTAAVRCVHRCRFPRFCSAAHNYMVSLRTPSPQVAGTHAIAVGLFSCLKPNDELLCVSGDPYDTLEEVLGVRGDAGIGNLSDWGVTSRCHYGLFTDDGGVDPSTITDSIDFGMTLITCCLHRDGNMAHVINRTPDICMQDVLVCAIFRGLVDTACGRLLQLKRFRLSSAQFVLLMTVSS
jgi:Methionine gamma-lyase